jgi:DNA-binding LacI/PurR family transcriptional regulator
MSTIRDVAKIAGVSTATVSRVINSPEAVSLETRDRVAKAMKACRYQYNALARGFVTQQSYTLGNTDYEYAKEARLCEVLRERQVEGLIITTTQLKGKVLRDLLDDHFPFVLLYSTVRKGPISAVGVDNFRGGYSATEHLIHLGHRRIAMLAGGFSFSDKSLHRWHGYKKCLRDHRIPYDPALVLQTQYALENGREGIKALLALDKPPTAVFCSNDFMAIGAMQGAREYGVATPGGLSIVGFDDMAIASYISPSLTTIRQPAYEMGRMGAEILLDRVKKRAGGPVHKILETSIVIRESAAPPARNQKTLTARRSP